MIKLIKIGDVIHNYTEDSKSISFIIDVLGYGLTKICSEKVIEILKD